MKIAVRTDTMLTMVLRSEDCRIDVECVVWDDGYEIKCVTGTPSYGYGI